MRNQLSTLHKMRIAKIIHNHATRVRAVARRIRKFPNPEATAALAGPKFITRLALVTLLLTTGSAIAIGAAAAKPNILLILADDVGWSDVGCYGSEIQTPNIDSLAKAGVKFTQFYNCARCCPSRATLLTGLYPQQAGVGNMTDDQGPARPGYRGTLQPDCVTLAEVLKPAGYGTYMVGKWHLRNQSDVKPTDRGFDEFYGMLGGYNSCWDENPYYTRWPKNRTPRTYTSAKNGRPGTFYSTDAFADYSLDFMAQARSEKKPFFLYLAFNAAHFPLHAPEKDIEKYEQLYFEKGWDVIRAERLAREKNLGLVPPDLALTPRSPVPAKSFAKSSPYAGKENPAWNSLPEDRRRDLARRMAVYAAMVDHMDQAIGRVVNDLKQHGDFDNTLILFLSDNGACWEWDPLGFDGSSGPHNELHTGEALKKMGGPESYLSYGSGWANACNTPWRYYKHFDFEGGTRTPFIVHWPAGMKAKNEIHTQIGHLIDLMPTLLEVAGASYPAERNGVKIQPMEGRSLVPAFANQPVVRAAPLFFEHDGSRAVRDGRWKLVSLVGDAWELYDMEADPAEMHNLITQLPDQAHTMMAAWNAWAKRCHVDATTNPFGHGGAEAHEPANVSPQIANHPLVIRCDVTTDARSGVVLAQGGREYGYALHLSEGRPVFSVRIARELFVAKSAKAVSGHFSLEARLEKDGKMKLFVNGALAATGQASGLIPTQPLDDLTVGEDEKSAVGDYAAPNPLNGKVDNVKITAE